jgi:hypothetical protein
MESSRPPRFRELSLARRISVAGYAVSALAVALELPTLPIFGLSDAVLHVLHYTTIGLLVVSAPFALGGQLAYMRQDARKAREPAARTDSTGPDGPELL